MVRQISGDFSRSPVGSQCISEELSGCADVASLGDVHVDDLAVLVHGPVHLAPDTADLDVGFVNEPTVTYRMTARPSGVDEHRGEALHPPVDGDVVNFDSSLCQEFFYISIRQAVAEVPADSQQITSGGNWYPEKEADSAGLRRFTRTHSPLPPHPSTQRCRHAHRGPPDQITRPRS